MKLRNKLTNLTHRLRELFYSLKWFSWKELPFNKTAVFVVDGRLDSCGMTDRFVGAISLYCWAKQNNISFKIQYKYPFDLEEFLVPNKYDWIVNDGDYVQSINAARIVYAIGEPEVYQRLNGMIHSDKQIHFYGNRNLLPHLNISPNAWGEAFVELFKPTERLRLKLSALHDEFGRYYSVCFRFQNLLGDFDEYNFKSISDPQEREFLVNKCINCLMDIKAEHPGENCVITSDSVYFLLKARDLGCMYIKGNLVHMGSNPYGTYEEYEKSFLDFYILAEGLKIYNVVIDNMYPSGFPMYAAKLHNIPFERIVVKNTCNHPKLGNGRT